MIKKTTKIEVGAHGDKVGYTQTYEDGTREHLLYSPNIALQLCEKLSQVARAMMTAQAVADSDVVVSMAPQPQQERPSGYNERVGISDHANIGLSTAKGEVDAENNGTKKIH